MNNYKEKNTVLYLRLLYPIWIVVAIFSVIYAPSVIFVEHDPLATAANVAKHNTLLRLSTLGSIATAVLMVYVAYYLYILFERVNKYCALLMLILALCSIPFVGFDVFKIIAAGSSDAEYIYESLNISRNVQTVAEVFWGLWLFPLALLVIESNYFPKILGYALIASCIGYLLAVAVKVAFPDYRNLLPIADVLAFGELVFALWIVFIGVKTDDKELQT